MNDKSLDAASFHIHEQLPEAGVDLHRPRFLFPDLSIQKLQALFRLAKGRS